MPDEKMDSITVSDDRPLGTSLAKSTGDIALRMGGLFAAIVVVSTVFIILNPAFASPYLAVSILRSLSSLAILALGLTMVIIVGEIDLSFAAMYGLAANALAVMWIIGGVPVYLALPFTLGIGAAMGLFNGVLVAFLKIPSFIVTLGTYNLLYGLSLWVTGTASLNPTYPPPGRDVPEGELAFFTGLTQSIGSYQVSAQVIWMLGIAIVMGVLLHKSLFGFRLMAIGGNTTAARVAGLPVRRYKIIAFVLSGVLAAMAGVLDFSFIQTTQPDIGLALTFPVFAAVIIGGASLSGGKGSVIGTLSGALLLAILQMGLALLSPGPHVQQLFLGAVTIAAVALDMHMTRLRERR